MWRGFVPQVRLSGQTLSFWKKWVYSEDMSSKSVLWVGLGVVVMVATVFIGTRLVGGDYTFNGSVIEPSIAATDFALEQAGGEVFRLSEQAGRVVLIFFGYTNCPDFCPTTLSDFKVVREELGPAGAEVRFVFITIDPERDTPEKIQTYAKAFHPEFIGLSGDEEKLQPIWDAFFVYRQKSNVETAAGYLMEHSTRVIVIDKAGNFRMTFLYGLGPEAMAEDVNYLLSE